MRGKFFSLFLRALFSVALVAAFSTFPAYASFSLNPSSFSNPNGLIDPAIAGPIIKTIGLVTDHRAYEGASPLGTSVGFEVSAQATLVKLPTDFRNALSQAGMGSLPVPVLPFPRLIAHKGLGERVDIGFSWILFKEIQVTGFDLKVVTFHPDEGPTWAVRMNYTAAKLSFTELNAELSVQTTTFKPEILVSQKLDFAEPYLGVGYQLTRGNLKVHIPLPAPLPTLDQTVSAKGGGGVAFIGLSLRVPNLALRLLVDGQYSTAGAHALGLKFGLNF